MVRHYAMQFLGACLLALLPLLAAVAQPVPGEGLTAFVDRTDVTINDLITLTIRVDAALGNNRPSFAGLNQDFEQVGGMSTRSTYTNNNGNIQSWTEYNITLRPLRTGELSIPEFRVAGQTTNPIAIRVGDATQAQAGGNDEIFLRSSVSKEDIYVQEQLIYTIRIYYSIGFDQGAQLSSPLVDNAVVQQLGSDRNLQEVVDGIGYNVTERRFVIYPQNSGDLNIPPVHFSASIGRRGGINRLFNNRATVREINISSDAHAIEVKPRPASFTGNTWLPASELTLEESWSGQLDNVSVGDAITRNVVLTVHGLSSSLLPGVEYQDLPGLRFYPDQPVREDATDGTGVIGTRSEGMAMVASRPGEFEIPEVRLPWWDTDSDSLQVAVLPARTIIVQPAGEADIDPAAIVPLPRDEAIPLQESGSRTLAGGRGATIWMFGTVLFGIAWLLTLFLLLAQRRQLASGAEGKVLPLPLLLQKRRAESQAQPESGQMTPSVTAALKNLQRACREGDASGMRKALIQWAKAAWDEPRIATLAALDERAGDEELRRHLQALDARLYGQQDSAAPLDPAALHARVLALQKAGPGKAERRERYQLPPLYRQ